MENKQKNSKKRLNSLILLVAFTAIMLIVSTYAWFSTQKNVTLGKLQGKVNVAEGLQISLDAKTWKNEIDFSAFNVDNDTGIWTSEVYVPGATLNEPYTLSDGSTTAKNVLPDELLPVSTTGTGEDAITKEQIAMYRGENKDAIKLNNIVKLTEEAASGYYAIDFFLQNSSASGVTVDPLQLEPNSSFAVLQSQKSTTGLQNTGRIALALYANSNDSKVTVNDTPTTEQIIEGTTGTNITSVAIWEPNANAHVQNIVDSNNYIKWSVADAKTMFGDSATGDEKFTTTTQMPTYALTSTSAGTSITNIYDWKTPSTGLAKQYTLQTTTAGITDPTQLVSAADGSTAFTIPGGQYVRMRMYVWLEGQDVDCTNYASLGGGVELTLGFSKPGTTQGS